jgi:hypothetical protein
VEGRWGVGGRLILPNPASTLALFDTPSVSLNEARHCLEKLKRFLEVNCECGELIQHVVALDSGLDVIGAKAKKQSKIDSFFKVV